MWGWNWSKHTPPPAPAADEAPAATAAFDPDALAFIAAHNALSGTTMGSIQQAAINGVYQRLKGAFTINATDFITANLIDALWLLAPITDSTTEPTSFGLDLFLNYNITWTGYLAADFQPTGLQGGAGKYGLTTLTPASLQDDSGMFVYKRSSGVDNTWVMGSSVFVGNTDGFAMMPNLTATTAWGRVFDSVGTVVTLTNPDNRGLILIQREGLKRTFWRNDVLNGTYSDSPITTKNTFGLMLMGLNRGGSHTLNWTGNAAMFGVCKALTPSQIVDLNDIAQWYQQNIITGGRNV